MLHGPGCAVVSLNNYGTKKEVYGKEFCLDLRYRMGAGCLLELRSEDAHPYKKNQLRPPEKHNPRKEGEE